VSYAASLFWKSQHQCPTTPSPTPCLWLFIIASRATVHVPAICYRHPILTKFSQDVTVSKKYITCEFSWDTLKNIKALQNVAVSKNFIICKFGWHISKNKTFCWAFSTPLFKLLPVEISKNPVLMHDNYVSPMLCENFNSISQAVWPTAWWFSHIYIFIFFFIGIESIECTIV